MTEKQTIRESLEQQRQQKLSEGKPKQAEFLKKLIEHIEKNKNDDMTSKHPLSELPVIEGKEVRIGETNSDGL